jgi:hypothetical protein
VIIEKVDQNRECFGEYTLVDGNLTIADIPVICEQNRETSRIEQLNIYKYKIAWYYLSGRGNTMQKNGKSCGSAART